jgi:hypothetical protein
MEAGPAPAAPAAHAKGPDPDPTPDPPAVQPPAEAGRAIQPQAKEDSFQGDTVQTPVAAPPQSVAPVSPAHPEPLSRELGAALAAQKTYGTKAFFVWFLYWLGWLPGVVMNLVYLSEANGIKRQTGVSPSGHGCLVVLFLLHVVLPLFLILLLVVLGGTMLEGLLG